MQSGNDGQGEFARNQFVILAQSPPFGMAEDDRARAGIGKHFGRDVPGMRAASLGMAILAAKRDLPRIPEADLEKLLWRNTARLWRIKV